jgi:small multidrug resistance pump
MQLYIILFFAIALEVLGTMLLPASQNFTKPLPTLILLVSYGASFYFLALVSQKLPLAIIYASWAGLGVFSVAMVSYFKNLNAGDYLIDDRTANGAGEFKGEHIHFLSEKFKNWNDVLNYLIPKE